MTEPRYPIIATYQWPRRWPDDKDTYSGIIKRSFLEQMEHCGHIHQSEGAALKCARRKWGG